MYFGPNRRRLIALLASLMLLFVASCGDDNGSGSSTVQDAGHLTDASYDVGEIGADSGVSIVRDKPLDLFVADDSGFEYEVAWENSGSLATSWLLDVTSGQWRSDEEVNRTTWRHDVILTVPGNATTDTALVIINGGDNDGGPLEQSDDAVKTAELVASLVRTPVVSISQIPNQPLTIVGEGEDMVEDDLVASSWHKAIETGDPTWSAYFPMARAVVRSMDAVQDHMAGLGTPVEGFVLAGFSKRGATTYLATAADERVIAMAPGVFDFLNFRPQAAHHLAVYGEPAPAVADYAEYNLLERVADPEAQILLETSDPYAYRDRFTMPKLIMASTGDQFFLPDAMQFYIDDLPGETLVRYVPNTGHGLTPEGQDLLDTIDPLVQWYKGIARGAERPTVSWTHDDGELTLTASTQPSTVRHWTATNDQARNFRIDVAGAIWESEELTSDSDSYTATVDAPAAAISRPVNTARPLSQVVDAMKNGSTKNSVSWCRHWAAKRTAACGMRSPK
jgi:PhoPQ-activated pathogenicity-related protein